jgi:heptosyltransferase-2
MMPKKILISLPNWLGDIVMSLPTIKGMRWLFPESHISVLVKANFASIFKYNHDVNEVIVYQRGEKLRKFISGWKMAKTIRDKNFDLALILPRSFNSALLPFLSKIPQRIGYAADTRTILLSHPIKRSNELLSQHRVYYFLNLLNHFRKSVALYSPSIKTGHEEERWANELLSSLNIKTSSMLVGFNAGAAYGDAKCWLPERYAKVAEKLIEKYDAHILLFGSKAEGRINSEIAKQLSEKSVLDLTGRTDIIQLAVLIKRCRIFVTNDTGPMHVAGALGIPIVAVFGPTDYITTSPFGTNHIIVRKSIHCSPCLERTCPTDHLCMRAVTVEDVFDACVKSIDK